MPENCHFCYKQLEGKVFVKDEFNFCSKKCIDDEEDLIEKLDYEMREIESIEDENDKETGEE
jgi:hypothetical protein